MKKKTQTIEHDDNDICDCPVCSAVHAVCGKIQTTLVISTASMICSQCEDMSPGDGKSPLSFRLTMATLEGVCTEVILDQTTVRPERITDDILVDALASRVKDRIRQMRADPMHPCNEIESRLQ